MSNPNQPSNDTAGVSISATALIWAIASMFCFTVAAVTAIAIAVPESQNPAGLVAQLLGSFATLVVALGTLFQVSRVRAQTTALTNGLGDAKNRLAIAAIVKPEHLRDDVDAQLAADQVTVEQNSSS